MTPGCWNRASVTAALQQYLKCISHTHAQGTFSPFLHLTAISKSQKKCFDSATTCVWEGQFVHLLATNLCQNFWGKKNKKQHTHCQAQLSKEKYAEKLSQKFPVISCWQQSLVKFYGGEKKKKRRGWGKKGGSQFLKSSWKRPAITKGYSTRPSWEVHSLPFLLFPACQTCLMHVQAPQPALGASARGRDPGVCSRLGSQPLTAASEATGSGRNRSAQTLALKLTAHSSQKDAIWRLKEQRVWHPR